VRVWTRIVLSCLLLLALTAGRAEATTDQPPDPATLIEQMRTPGLDVDGAVVARDFRFRSGPATVYFENGVLVPTRPVGDRPVEFVFVGEGRIVVEPPDDVEAGQLELFTGARQIDETFGAAVFVITLDSAVDAIRQLPRAEVGEHGARAAALLEGWRNGPERRFLDVESRLFIDAVGGPLGANYFCGFFEGVRLGSFLYVVDPMADEQVTMGQFVQPELTDRERRQLRKRLQRSQKQGKLIGLELTDVGMWDTWMSTHLHRADGEPGPGSSGVEPVHYRLDCSLDGKELELEATARLDLTVLVDGLNTVTLDMSSDLVPTEVRDADGHPLVFVRSRGELTAALPGPLESGSTTTIEVRYTGRPFERLSPGTYAQRSSLNWYPHAGSLDRATYDVTLRWPDTYDLVGSGRVVESGNDDEGRQWQRRRLDIRALGFSFEIGKYEIVSGRQGHVEVRVAVDRATQELPGDLARDVLSSVQDSLSYFEEIFGPYPLDELVVVNAPRDHSQGLLGFVTLSTLAIQDWAEWGAILGFEDRRTVIAHEVAHQWWGNLVGWRSYRDQWISEAAATYSALLYARNRLGFGPAELRSGPTKGWQSALLRPLPDGRPVESVGPVVLGTRLFSSVTMAAYYPIVYKKGAVVLDMLARLYGEPVFVEILGRLVQAAADRSIATEDFLLLLERIGGTDLDWFGSQYVYGTGLPEIEYDYRFEPIPDGRWTVSGVALQRAPHVYSYRIEPSRSGVLDLRREATTRMDVSESVLVVPIDIGVILQGATREPATPDDSRVIVSGRVVLEGETSEYRLELEHEPEIVWFDHGGEVFGRFFCTQRRPRRAAYQRGLAMAAGGHLEDAESAFLDALASPVAVYPEAWQGLEGDVEYEGELIEAATRLALARLYLETDRAADAEDQLKRARAVISTADRRRFEAEMLALDARVSLANGNVSAASRSLRRGLLGSRSADSIEGWGLLTIASNAAGQADTYATACSRAIERGIDLGPLECP
jgi:hypothetical protein